MGMVTRCRNAETGGVAELPTEILGVWAAHGWEPITGVSRTSDAAEQERVDAENAAAAAPAPAPAPPISPEVAPAARQPGTTAGDAGTEKEN